MWTEYYMARDYEVQHLLKQGYILWGSPTTIFAANARLGGEIQHYQAMVKA